MITSDFSEVILKEGKYDIHLKMSVAGSLRLFDGQELFGCYDKGSKQLLLSPIKLNPTINYFRVYFNNEVGGIAKLSAILKDYNVNIVGGGGFVLGNLGIFEVTADFEKATGSPDMVRSNIQEKGGVVLHRRITEIIPLYFGNQTIVMVQKNDVSDVDKPWRLSISKSVGNKIGIDWAETSFAIIKNYSRIPALLIEFFQPNTQVVRITANLLDEPGALYELSDALKDCIDFRVTDQARINEKMVKWVAIGILMKDNVDEVREKAKLPMVMKFDIERIGW